MMSNRMQAYRNRMAEKGVIQVRIWIEKQDEDFVKYLAKFCRLERKKNPKKRFGRPASERQIELAQEIAFNNDIQEPTHLYNYHISLAAWMWRHGGR